MCKKLSLIEYLIKVAAVFVFHHNTPVDETLDVYETMIHQPLKFLECRDHEIASETIFGPKQCFLTQTSTCMNIIVLH